MSAPILSTLRTVAQLGAGVGFLLASAACDYSGDFLFADIPDVPPILHITPEDSDYIVPSAPTTPEEVKASIIYAEVGAPPSAAPGGVTLNFKGTGSDVCVWVDPELAFWNQKVGQNPSQQGAPYVYPDNVFDDGDLDLYVGLSVYYTGSPGEEMGDFFVSYEDSLGNEIPIELSSCGIRGFQGIGNAHAGRGNAEYCTVADTTLDVSYTIALQTFSTPLDDDRLAFGILLFDGTCSGLQDVAGFSGPTGDECVITGEAANAGITGPDYGPWFGYDAERVWAGSEEFEFAFCASDLDGEALPAFCESEYDRIEDDGLTCGWNVVGEGFERCYCGDVNDTPEGGEG